MVSGMPRLSRIAPGGQVYHVLNRSRNGRRLFRTPADFQAFDRALQMAVERRPVRLLGWCVMEDHWHVVLHVKRDDDLSRFFGLLALSHAGRWRGSHRSSPRGRMYESRFRHFMIQRDEHLLDVLRFVESNPLRAGLVKRAQEWIGSSLHARLKGPAEMRHLIAEWPVQRPRDWTLLVNRKQEPKQIEQIALCIARGRPYGDETWTRRVVQKYGLESTIRPRGRQKGWRKKTTR
jgi:putative transposase